VVCGSRLLFPFDLLHPHRSWQIYAFATHCHARVAYTTTHHHPLCRTGGRLHPFRFACIFDDNSSKIVGDDTLAIDSVLKADVWRDHLLKEEVSLNAKLSALEAEGDDKRFEDAREEASTRLAEVHARLAEMDAESGPARAAALLAGEHLPRSINPSHYLSDVARQVWVFRKKISRDPQDHLAVVGGASILARVFCPLECLTSFLHRMRLALARALFVKVSWIIMHERVNDDADFSLRCYCSTNRPITVRNRFHLLHLTDLTDRQ
jgi:hypothetical protein